MQRNARGFWRHCPFICLKVVTKIPEWSGRVTNNQADIWKLGLPNMKLECQPFDCVRRWEDDRIIRLEKEWKVFNFGPYKGTKTKFFFKRYEEPWNTLLNIADKPAKCRIPYLLNTRVERYQNQISQNPLRCETRHGHTASSRRFISGCVVQSLNQAKVKLKVAP